MELQATFQKESIKLKVLVLVFDLFKADALIRMKTCP